MRRFSEGRERTIAGNSGKHATAGAQTMEIGERSCV